MGPVYRGLDRKTNRPVAIKALNPAVVVDQPVLLDRFQREGRMLQELNHPNIVHWLDAVEQDSTHYLIMEYIEGGSLRDLLDGTSVIDLERALEISLDLADALARAHRLGIIHRDLKPENVLLANDGTPRLSDFGVACQVRHAPSDSDGSLNGTWFYIPPEAYRGIEADERTDIWSFGVLLFEMLAGRVPFMGESPGEVMNSILFDNLPSLRELRPSLPEGLYALIEAMLTKDRERRLSSIRIVGAALEALARGQEVTLPAAARTSQPHSIPSLLGMATPFVGRERELKDIQRWITDPGCRLITLTGPGGVGKTRLAMQAARMAQELFEDGLYFVDLAPILDSSFVLNRIARELGVKEAHTRALIEDILEVLRGKHMLLVLDNFEQVLPAAPVISHILSSDPTIKVLVTSRESLHIYGEHEYQVPPLHLPDLMKSPPFEVLSECESVALFVQRAQAANPGFMLTQENAADIAEICIRLDGLPLAIELAAVRVKLFTPRFLLTRLNDTMGILTGGARDLAARHQTLRAAIDWSYQLLTEPEKRLFERLAVFQGGMNLEAVAAVCETDGLDVLESVESLHNKSLIKEQQGLEGEPRFVLLETIHQFAWEKLQESGEAEQVQDRHASYFVEFTERAAVELRGARQEQWSGVLRNEYDNLRTALGWLLQLSDPGLGLRLVGALSEYWYYEGPVSEGEKWISIGLARAGQAEPADRIHVYIGASMMAFVRGDTVLGKKMNGQALAIARQGQNKSEIARALFWLAAHCTSDPKDYEEGLKLCVEAEALYQELNDKPGLAWVYNQIGELKRLLNDYGGARIAYEQSVAVCWEVGNKRRAAIALVNLSYAAQHQGDYEQAEQYAMKGLRLLQELNLKYHITIVLAMLAGPVAAQGQAERAARLLGASEAIFEGMSVNLQPADRVEIDGYIAIVRRQLDPDQFQQTWAEGRNMTFEEAIRYALEGE